MLGHGYAAFPQRVTPGASTRLQGVAGYYHIDDYHAAIFLAYELADPELNLAPDEALEKANLLSELLEKLQRSVRLTLEQLNDLRKLAESIPGIGPILFSPTSLPGTIVSAGTLAAAVAMNKPAHQLLDLTRARKKALYEWSRSRGTKRAKAGKKLFSGRVKIVSLGGKLYLDVPITADAKRYLVNGRIPNSSMLVPVSHARAMLAERAMLNPQGATGALRFATGPIVGAVVAIGPQAYVDYRNSQDLNDFLHRSAYSQPTNILSYLAGAGVGGLAAISGIPIIVVIIIGASFTVLMQYGLSILDANNKIGNALTRKNDF
jgi:hypothetical protein